MIEVIEESHFNSKIAIINIFFASFPSHLTTQKHYFVTISVTCHMDFGNIIPKYQAKPLSLLLLCESAMTPLWLRFFACRDYTYNRCSTLTYNGQIGQKQIGQIHLFNLLLPNLPIDFILVDNIGQRIPPVAPERTQGWVNERQTQEACYTIRPMITNTRGVTLWRLCASSS